MKRGWMGLGFLVASLPANALAKGGEVMSFAGSTLFWTWVTFISVLLILWKFAWGPLAKSLQDREDRIRKAIDDAEAARDKAEQQTKELEARLESARAEAEAIIKEGREDALKVKEKYERDQRTEGEAIKQRALNEIDLAKGKALSEIRQQARALSVEIARKILEREVSEKDHAELVEQVLAGYDAAIQEAESEG